MGYIGYMIVRLCNSAYVVISTIILISCIISWMPGINRYKEPIRTIDKISDAILNPIRDFMMKKGFYMPVDISPVIALFLMRVILEILYFIL